MQRKLLTTLGLLVSIVSVSCKNSPSSSTSTAQTENERNATSSAGDQVTKMTQADVQEFYEIVKNHYLERAKVYDFSDDGRFEAEFYKKFGVPLSDNTKIYNLAKNMFDFMESGNYAIVLHGIPKRPTISALPPKGMTNRDLENFLQITKTEYFKHITGVQLHNFGAQELRFYARMQGLSPTSMPRQGDMLIIAGDLYNRIETGK